MEDSIRFLCVWKGVEERWRDREGKEQGGGTSQWDRRREGNVITAVTLVTQIICNNIAHIFVTRSITAELF